MKEIGKLYLAIKISHYVTADICNVQLRRVMIDAGYSLNIISLSTLEALGIPQDITISSLWRCQVSKVMHHSLLALLTSTRL